MRSTVLSLLGAVAYATVRYNVCKGVAWSDWPVYTLNKAYALAALVLMLTFVVRTRLAQGMWQGRDLSAAGLFAGLHVFVSLILLSPAYYDKLYLQGRLTASAGFAMLLGAVAAAMLAAGALRRGGQGAVGGVMPVALLAFIAGLHAGVQGFAGWFAPLKWPGLMPPITLISFLLGAAAVVVAGGSKAFCDQRQSR